MAITRIFPTQYIVGNAGDVCTIVRILRQEEDSLFMEIPSPEFDIDYRKYFKDFFYLDKEIYPEFKGINQIKYSFNGDLIVVKP